MPRYKVSFPHIGLASAAVESFFNLLGFDVVTPPPLSRETLILGAQYSPEFACLPLKANLGSFLQIDPGTVDLIFMAGGIGPCRFGLYGEVQREILRHLGNEIPFVVIEPPEKEFSEVVNLFQRYLGPNLWVRLPIAITVAWQKVIAMDSIERTASNILPILPTEKHDTFLREKTTHLKNITETDSIREIRQYRKQAMEWSADYSGFSNAVLRVKIVGELLVVLEPAINFGIVELLGRMGVQVRQTIDLSSWIYKNLFLNLVHIPWQKSDRDLVKPYLSRFIGGHGLESVAHSLKAAQDSFDGVVQLAPLGCMPELIAMEIIQQVSKDSGIPTLSLLLDEHTSSTGIQTRLEAFVDLLRNKQKRSFKMVSSL